MKVLRFFVMLVSVLCIPALVTADQDSRDCVERTLWREATATESAGFKPVKLCFITCRAGSHSKECAKNDKCFCRCLDNGLPECTCHPQGGPSSKPEVHERTARLPAKQALISEVAADF